MHRFTRLARECGSTVRVNLTLPPTPPPRCYVITNTDTGRVLKSCHRNNTNRELSGVLSSQVVMISCNSLLNINVSSVLVSPSGPKTFFDTPTLSCRHFLDAFQMPLDAIAAVSGGPMKAAILSSQLFKVSTESACTTKSGKLFQMLNNSRAK